MINAGGLPLDGGNPEAVWCRTATAVFMATTSAGGQGGQGGAGTVFRLNVVPGFPSRDSDKQDVKSDMEYGDWIAVPVAVQFGLGFEQLESTSIALPKQPH